MKNYDAHIIVKYLHCSKCITKDCYGRDVDINILGNNQQAYIGMKIGNFKFTDSNLFMTSSLQNLVETSTSAEDNKKGEKFSLLKKHFSDDGQFLKVLRKGVYPYTYMSSRHKFKETQLPPIESFYNDLTDENISEDDYQYAQDVWKTFNCRTMKDYHDL